MKNRSFFAFLLTVTVLSAGVPLSQAAPKKQKLTSERTEAGAEKKKLLLSTGEDKVIDVDFDANAGPNGITIGNPKVVATTLVKVGDQRQIVFKPLSEGDTTVTVRDDSGFVKTIFNVTVSGTNLLKTANEIRDLLKDIEGLNIRVLGSKIVIDGEVMVPGDYARLLSVLDGKNSPYSGVVLNLALLSPIALQLLAKRIQEDVSAFAPNVKTRVVNGQVWLEGQVDSYEQAKRAARVAELYLPELRPGSALEKDPTVQRAPPKKLVENFIVINPPPPKKQEKLVRVTVHFVELAKDYKKVFGFKWQPGFTTDPQITVGTTQQGGAGASGVATFTGTISSLLPKLQSAQDAGFARILKTGTIIIRSGKAGNLTDEINIPYAVQGANGEVTTATANVGLNVAVTPLILGTSDDIEMDLELSQVNLAGRTTASAPITSKHTVKTKVYVKSSESAAVAGVTSGNVQTNFNKDDPNTGTFQGQTSPLFTLMRSKSYNKQKSQFVIFVTPQIIENASEGTEDMKRNFRLKVN